MNVSFSEPPSLLLKMGTKQSKAANETVVTSVKEGTATTPQKPINITDPKTPDEENQVIGKYSKTI